MSLKVKSPVWEMFQKMISLEAVKDKCLQRCHDCKGATIAKVLPVWQVLMIAKVLPVWQRCDIDVL